MALTPPPAVPQRGDRTTFSQRVDAFLNWMANLIPQLNQFLANLDSLAAGGAYALPYVFGAGDINGYLNANTGAVSQSASTYWVINNNSMNGSVIAQLQQFAASNSIIKGHLRLVKSGDPSKFLILAITSMQDSGLNYHVANGITVAASEANPFTPGDDVILQFQRTGDKGDKGDSGTLFAPALHVRDERASGQSGGSPLVNQDWNLRALLAVKTNTIQGASLSNNRVTLPAGTYEYEGSAPASATSEHQARLYNVTDQTAVGLGTSEVATSTGGKPPTTRSFIQGRFTITAPKVFELQHWVFNGGNQFAGGYPVSNGGIEVYSEIIFRKAT